MGLRVVVRPRALADAELAPLDCTYEFEQERVLVGRAPASDVRLPDASVGARHLSLRVEAGRYVAVDHGSLNGTRLNGTPLVPERPRALRDGDVLDVGSYRLEVALGAVVAQATSRERTLSLARRLLGAELGGAATSSRLVVVNGPAAGREIPLPVPPATLRIGRASSCEIALDDADCSREHAEVIVDLDGALVRDLRSKNGIEVNGRKVAERRLRDRDEIVVGATVLAFEDTAEQELAARASAPEIALPPAPEEDDGAESERTSAPASPETPAEDTAAREPTEPVRPALRAPSVDAPAPLLRGPELVVLLVALAVLAASIAGLLVLLGD